MLSSSDLANPLKGISIHPLIKSFKKDRKRQWENFECFKQLLGFFKFKKETVLNKNL